MYPLYYYYYSSGDLGRTTSQSNVRVRYNKKFVDKLFISSAKDYSHTSQSWRASNPAGGYFSCISLMVAGNSDTNLNLWPIFSGLVRVWRLSQSSLCLSLSCVEERSWEHLVLMPQACRNCDWGTGPYQEQSGEI